NICTGGETDVITLNLTKPIQTGGLYSITFQTGVDGSTIVDECGLNLPVHTRSFTAYDTVNAEFSFNSILGCRNNIVQFSHNGANQVNSWVWDINSTRFANVRNTQASFSASSTNQISLKVSNGVCDDEYSTTLVMNNEVKAGFEIPAIICPED